MLPKYTFALGGTDTIKRLIEYLEQQPSVVDTLKQKLVVEEPAV